MAERPRSQSYYDADRDVYHLSSGRDASESKGDGGKHAAAGAHRGGRPVRALNTALRSKDAALQTLDAEVLSANRKLREAEARNRYHEENLRAALSAAAARHRDQVENLKAHAHKAARVLKARVAKAEKQRKDARAEVGRAGLERDELQRALDEARAARGRGLGEVEALTARVGLLTRKLEISRSTRQDERKHSQQVEINLREIGSRLENVLRENRRLQGLRRDDDRSRDSIIETHGKHMRALTEQLDARSKQLMNCEQKKSEAIASRDEALSMLDALRMGHETKLEGRDTVLSRQRDEIAQLKDSLAKRDRDGVVQSGRIEQLEREVAQTRRDLDSKSTQLHDLEARLRSEREAEHGMSASKAEAMGRLAGMERAAQEQADTIARLREDLAAERDRASKQFHQDAARTAALERELAASRSSATHQTDVEHARGDVAEQRARDLERQVRTLEAALEVARNDSARGVSGGAGELGEELRRLHGELDKKDLVIAQKDKELAVCQQQVKDLEAEVARRTLRAAGMAADKIQTEKARLQEDALYEKRRLEDEMREKERLLAERRKQLEEEAHEREMRDRVAAERRKWEDERQREHERAHAHKAKDLKINGDDDSNIGETEKARQERWELMERMQQMEREMDDQMAAKKLQNASTRSNKLHPRAPMGHPDKHRRGSSHHHAVALAKSVPAPKIPDAEKMLGFDKRTGGEQMDERSEKALRELINRADALREEAIVRKVGSPELIERVEALTLELAERIAIECYDVGEHLYEIMDDAHPVLMQATMRQRAPRARARDVADAKNTIAATMSVARSRVRAALHLSRDGVLYWLLSLYGNVAALLQGLRQPDSALIPYDDASGRRKQMKRELQPVAGKLSSRKRKKRKKKSKRFRKGGTEAVDSDDENTGQDDPNSIVASRDLVRVCSNQWTERRWPSAESGMLSEVRAAVEKAAEDEYWRRYAEAMSDDPERHLTSERDGSRVDVDEPNANAVFWQLLVSRRGFRCSGVFSVFFFFFFS